MSSSTSQSLLEAFDSTKDWKESKKSVKDCLRSKALPDGPVKMILRKPSFTQDDLHISCESVQHELQDKTETSAIARICRVSKALRLVQLLLELQKQPENLPVGADLSNRWVVSLIEDVMKQNQLSGGLGQDKMNRLFGGGFGKHSDTQVALFAFASLLRLTPYVEEHAFLLKPLWKGLCEMTAFPLPNVLVRLAVQRLAHLMSRGSEVLFSIADTDHKLRISKVLNFLLMRMACFAPHVRRKDSLDFMQCLAPLMALKVTNFGTDLRATMVTLSTKVERCWSLWLQPRPDDTTTVITELQQLLSSTPDIKHMNAPFIFGCSDMALQILAQGHVMELKAGQLNEESVESLLTICSGLVFHTLPYVQNPLSLISPCVETIAEILFLCETHCAALATNPWPGRRPLHFMLVLWLNDCSRHALSRELCLSILLVYLRAMHDYDEAEFGVLVEFLCKATFDCRCNQGLQSNLVSLLSSVYETLPPARETMKSTLQVCRRRLLKTTSPRKRKRGEVSSFSVCQVIACLPLLELLEPLEYEKSTKNSVRFMLSGSNANSLQDAIDSFSKAKRDGGSFRTPACIFLHQIRLCCASGRALFQHEFNAISKLIEKVVQGSNDLELELQTLETLATLGPHIPASSSSEAVKGLARGFHALLSKPNWALRSMAVTSMLEFASSVPACHKSVIPDCVPSEMNVALQNRLKGKPPMDGDKVSEMLLQQNQVAPRRTGNEPNLRRPKELQVATGSLVISMPTREGRCATVIFPPGRQSREDIAHLVGEDKDNAPDVWKLNNSTVVQDGSCRLKLSET